MRAGTEARVFFAACPIPSHASPNDDVLLLLTSAQRAVVTRVAVEGTSLKSAAKDLGITVGTARVHLREAYRRLDVHDRSELRRRLFGS